MLSKLLWPQVVITSWGMAPDDIRGVLTCPEVEDLKCDMRSGTAGFTLDTSGFAEESISGQLSLASFYKGDF
ncbi:hypothetical protein GRJ2_001671100 [Grus japonensis]|uniref:Uncharacterized protein n=1 Tax=Grus japonensis TaxID=30415 RepID=A0ABC9X307_GRUJA